MKLNRGTLTVDLIEIVDALTAEQKRELAKTIACDNYAARAIVESVASGNCFTDDSEGWWGLGCTKELREMLLPLMDEVVRETVRDLITAKRAAEEEATRYRDWGCAIYSAWPKHELHSRPSWPALTFTDKASDEAVDAALRAKQPAKEAP